MKEGILIWCHDTSSFSRKKHNDTLLEQTYKNIYIYNINNITKFEEMPAICKTYDAPPQESD